MSPPNAVRHCATPRVGACTVNILVGRVRAGKKATIGVPLVVLESPYRNRVGALLRYLDVVERRLPEGPRVVTLVLSEIVLAKLWQLLLHNGMNLHLKSLLLVRSHGGDQRAPASE